MMQDHPLNAANLGNNQENDNISDVDQGLVQQVSMAVHGLSPSFSIYEPGLEPQKMSAAEEELAFQLASISPSASEDNNSEEAQAEAKLDESAEGAETYAQLDEAVAGEIVPEIINEEEQAEEDAEALDMAQAAQDLAGVEPAAGGESSGAPSTPSGGGYGFQSGFEAQGVIGLEDVGPIDPTQLEYGIEYNRDELFIDDEEGEGSTTPPNDIPEIFGATADLDETSGFNLTHSDTLIFDFGNDGGGTIEPSSIFSSDGSLAGGNLYSGGNEVIVTPTATGYIGLANGQPVFTFRIDPQTGEYTYNQLMPFDHADGNDPNDTITLNFGVQISDSDGDTMQETVVINVSDDAPISIDNEVAAVDETDMAPDVSKGGQLNGNFGEDGAGIFGGNGQIPTQSLTSNNEAVDIVFNSLTNTYTGSTASGGTIFTLGINSNGSYEFNLMGTLDHPDPTNPDDVIALDFGIQATDFDGDSIDGTLTINVKDDAPVAHDDMATFDLALSSVDGNVLTNDEFSQDVDNTVTEISFGTNSVTVPDTGDISIDGDYGTLTISADGSYTYELFSGAGTTSSTSSFKPVSADAIGTQTSLTQDGITVSIANSGNYDISWVDTADGSGLGIDNLNTGDSKKVWPTGETFDIDFAKDAQTVSITIAEIGSNNDGGQHGVDLVLTLDNGTTVNVEQQFVPTEINDGEFTFTLDASDYGATGITSIALNSTNSGNYKGASFLLNDIEATYGSSSDVCDEFEYTLTDGDGDSSSATLMLKGLVPTLIVGENVSDTDTSGTEHHIGGDEGAIVGGAAGDILIGDVGGVDVQTTTQDYNFVFILDVSGSMGSKNNANSRISLLKDAVESTLNDLGAYQSGEVMVHIVPFATNVQQTGTFTISNADELTAAINYLEGMTGNGYTNYESPLQEANLWLQSGEALGGDAITTTYFISDGAPNRSVNDDTGAIQSGNANNIMNQITGADGSNEVALLQSLSDDVIAVGINVGNSVLTRLSVIDSDGDAVNVDDPNDLSVVLKDTSPLKTLDEVGDDDIQGGDGDDIIFGDSVNTDQLSDDEGLGNPDGKGWEAFDQLENGQGANTPDWDRDDTVDYIKNNHEELAAESTTDSGGTRQGGNDTIHGGDGDDIIYGQEGDDIIYGGAGENILSGGSGADTFVMEAVKQGIDVIRDFDANEGDVLDISGLLQNYDPVQQAIDDFVFTRDEGGGTVLSVDITGSGDASKAVDIVALEGIDSIDLQGLVENGNINIM